LEFGQLLATAKRHFEGKGFKVDPESIVKAIREDRESR
jgi:hypothetical protein